MSLWTNALCDKCGFVLMHCQCGKFQSRIADAGFKPKKIWEGTQAGPGEFASYADYLFERCLQAKEELEPKPQELWEAMKAQLNFYQRNLAKAAEDYTKLENRLRDANNYASEISRSHVEEKLKLLAEIDKKNKELGFL